VLAKALATNALLCILSLKVALFGDVFGYFSAPFPVFGCWVKVGVHQYFPPYLSYRPVICCFFVIYFITFAEVEGCFAGLSVCVRDNFEKL